MKALFLDTETGGLDPRGDALTSVSVVLFDMTKKGMEILKTFNVLITPHHTLKVSEEALKVQGITFEDLTKKDRVTDAEAFKAFEEWLTEVRAEYNIEDVLPIFAHNAPFDKGFIVEWFYRNTFVKQHPMFNSYTSRHAPWFCTIQIANLLTFTGKINKPEKGYSLNSLSEHFKLKVRESAEVHNSLEDCLIGAELAAILFKKGNLV